MPPRQENSSGEIYSVGFTQGRCPDQSPTLVQGMHQIIETTPASLEYFTFQFSYHQIELHKIDNGAMLLVFSEGQFCDHHSKAISELIQFIKADYQALVDSIQTINAAHHQEHTPKHAGQLPAVRIDDLLEAMNSISQVTRRYLGSRFVADYWQASSQQPHLTWIQRCQIATDGTLSVTDSLPELTPEQLAELRTCMQRLHQQCTRFIRDYDTLVAQSLPQHHWQLLFGE